MDKLFAAFIIFSALWEILVPAKLIFLVHLEEKSSPDLAHCISLAAALASCMTLGKFLSLRFFTRKELKRVTMACQD